MPLIHVSQFVNVFCFGYFSPFFDVKYSWVREVHIESGQLEVIFYSYPCYCLGKLSRVH